MLLNEITPAVDRSVIRCSGGKLWIGGVSYSSSRLAIGRHVLEWAPRTPEEIGAASLEPVVTADPPVDLLLVGTGSRLASLGAEVTEWLQAAGIAVEAMATSSAIRAYNALVADAREVAVALLVEPR